MPHAPQPRSRPRTRLHRPVRPAPFAAATTAAFALALAAAGAPAARAQTRTWFGTGSTANWSNPDNWNPFSPPPTGDPLTYLQFFGSAPASNNDLGEVRLSRLEFDVADRPASSGFDLSVSGGLLDFRAAADGGPARLRQGSAANVSVGVASDLLLTSSLVVDVAAAGGSLGLSGRITGDGLLRKTGDGTLSLNRAANLAANGYGGGTWVDGGRLLVVGAGVIPAGGDLRITGGSFEPLLAPVTIGGDVTFGDGVSLRRMYVDGSGPIGSDLTLGGNVTFNGAGSGENVTPTAVFYGSSSGEPGMRVVLAAGSQHVVTVNGPSSSLLYGVVFDAPVVGGGGLTIRGGATSGVALNQAGGVGGPVRVETGTLYLTAANALANAAMRVDAGASLSLVTLFDDGLANVRAGSYSQTLGSLEGAGRVLLGAATLTVGANDQSTTFSGPLVGGTAASPVGGALFKVGTGTLTLGGVSTYTGFTAVGAGTLVVDGSVASSSRVTVASGATIAGTGVLPAVTLNAGATLAPGSVVAGVGTLSATSLLWDGGGTLAFDLRAGGVSDRLALAADLTKGSAAGGPFRFDFAGAGALPVAPDAWTLISFATTDFSLADFTHAGLPQGLDGRFEWGPPTGGAGGTPTSLRFVVSASAAAVPEPGAASLALLGLGLLGLLGLARTKRRRRRA